MKAPRRDEDARRKTRRMRATTTWTRRCAWIVRTRACGRNEAIARAMNAKTVAERLKETSTAVILGSGSATLGTVCCDSHVLLKATKTRPLS